MTHAFARHEQVQYFQIDHTSRCNLLCLQCSRVHQGTLNPSLSLDELTLNDYENIFAQGLWPQLKEIFFCGNFGDASVSPSFLPALQYLRATRSLNLKLSTNGSAQPAKWWTDLAQILTGPRDLVAFSIDGMQSTNSIYRVNSRWEKIMENANAYIAAGGRARWDYIVFSHNEHQIDEARDLAKKMGFVAFTVKKSNRFLNFENSKVKEPKNPIHRGQAVNNLNQVVKAFGSWEEYLSKTPIQCRFRKDQIGLFIDFQAKLWPCTWLAAPLHQHDEVEQTPYLKNIVSRFGENFNSLRHFAAADVLNHPWFAAELVKSWQDESARSPTCARNCGDKIHYSSEHSSNRGIEKLQTRDKQ